MTIEITDYDGIISLINAETYQTFVDEDWELEQLKEHFTEQMKQNALLVWQTNNFGGGNWKIKVTTTKSNKLAHSEFISSIEVTTEELYLADYTDLTMAAQFEDNKIPAEEHEHQKIELENGYYLVKVKRLFDPEEEINEEHIAFEIVLTKTSKMKSDPIKEIFWATF